MESVTAGVSKGLDQGVKEVGDVGHQSVEEAKKGAEKATGVYVIQTHTMYFVCYYYVMLLCHSGPGSEANW